MSGPSQSPTRFDVAIIGLGPTGATLANLLGLCGLSVLVLEREAAAYHLPRAVHFDDEVMRVFQTIGLADEITKIVRVNPGMRFVDPAGKLLLDWPRPQVVGPQGWHASYRFHQPDLEKILRAGLERFERVEVRSRTELTGAEDNGHSVTLRCQDLAKTEAYSLEARYLVGCDGARSTVRGLIGTEMEDLGFQERWLVIDTLLKRPKPELGDHTIQHCDPARPATYVRCPGNRRRWEITVREEETAEEIASNESVWKLLRPWLSPAGAEIERKAVYSFRSAVAKSWRDGRLLIAGDAAHLTPPFMGQGMCAGIRDAANLAWKLALCAKSLADDSLLDSYQSERLPHAKTYIETAMRLGGLINTCGTEEALRAAFPQGDGSARMESIAPPLGPGLTADRTQHRGRLFPQPLLSNGARLDDHCGYAPVLLASKSLLMDCRALVEKATTLGIAVLSSDEEDKLRRALEKLETKSVLLRPDRYILGTAGDSSELTSLLSGLLPSPLLKNTQESDATP